jgi:sugar lactone lactonase YvrE
VTLNQDGSVSVPAEATATVLTTGINAPDGIAVDSRDKLWVVANHHGRTADVLIVIPRARSIR